MPVNKKPIDAVNGTKVMSASSDRARRTAARPTLEHTDPSEGISEEQIRRRAYEIFQRRGGQPGDPTGDWLEAERELTDEQRSTKPGRRRPR